jgi:hypothetical protein
MKVGYVGNNLGTLKFNGVSASATGSYVLQIRYTNGDAMRTAYLSINGGAGTSVTFPSTGGFSTVGSLHRIVQLNSGSNTLRFYNPSSWAPDFDRIQLGSGSSDFNDDGRPDYPLYNASTRQTAIWYLNNNVYVGGAYGPTLPAGWQLVDSADFNLNGRPDYVLYNASTRQTAIWYLNNNLFVNGLYGPTPPAGWQLVAVADVNLNGRPDYVLYNASTRQTAIWYLNNNLFVSGAFGPTLPANWRIVGVVDFNLDGKPDYALYNASTRQTAIWYLNNNLFVNGLYGPTPPAGWQLVAVADVNLDGKPDYVLCNASTRQTAIWYLNNNLFVSGAFGPTLPAGWNISSCTPPTVTTSAATNFSSGTSATLNGTVNPNGSSTTVYFQYGTTTSYGSTTPNQTFTGSTTWNVSSNISGLTPFTTYHFRIVATNCGGTNYGVDRTFIPGTTGCYLPVVETREATDVADTCATLHGTVNPNGLSTTVHFEYDNGGQHHLTPTQTFNGNTEQDVSRSISGLIPNTFSSFVLVATNQCGTSTSVGGESFCPSPWDGTWTGTLPNACGTGDMTFTMTISKSGNSVSGNASLNDVPCIVNNQCTPAFDDIPGTLSGNISSCSMISINFTGVTPSGQCAGATSHFDFVGTRNGRVIRCTFGGIQFHLTKTSPPSQCRAPSSPGIWTWARSVIFRWVLASQRKGQI